MDVQNLKLLEGLIIKEKAQERRSGGGRVKESREGNRCQRRGIIRKRRGEEEEKVMGDKEKLGNKGRKQWRRR